MAASAYAGMEERSEILNIQSKSMDAFFILLNMKFILYIDEDWIPFFLLDILLILVKKRKERRERWQGIGEERETKNRKWKGSKGRAEGIKERQMKDRNN